MRPRALARSTEKVVASPEKVSFPGWTGDVDAGTVALVFVLEFARGARGCVRDSGPSSIVPRTATAC